MRFSRTIVLIAVTFTIFLVISLPSLLKDLIWLLSSRAFRSIFSGPAPLLCSKQLSQIGSITYVVGLAPGYSLERHKQTCGQADDLEQAIIGVVEIDDPLFGNSTLYDVKIDDATLLDAIRSNFFGLLYWSGPVKARFKVGRPGMSPMQDDCDVIRNPWPPCLGKTSARVQNSSEMKTKRCVTIFFYQCAAFWIKSPGRTNKGF